LKKAIKITKNRDKIRENTAYTCKNDLNQPALSEMEYQDPG
jgi:hypothetical protein